MNLRKYYPIIALFALACSPAEEETIPTGEMRAPVLPETMFEYADVQLPEHFLTPGMSFFESTPASNPTTNAGATLGRVLFYDRELSASRSVSCGSCHKQEHGFADPAPGSMGHAGGITSRNASHLVNLSYNFRLFWDLRADGLEEQVLMPIQDELEMGMTLPMAVERVKAAPYYAELFEAAFGDAEVTEDRIADALAQFVRSILSYQTSYDEGVETEFANFTESELLGKQIFFNGATRCNQCHMTHNFYTPQAFINGLETDYADDGVGALSGDAEDMGKFKVPSLRNVALTAPYMHDGRFNSLEEVVEHYNSGVQPHPFLDDRLTSDSQVGGAPYQLQLTETEKAALVDFLHTLTDHVLVNDEKFSDPFAP